MDSNRLSEAVAALKEGKRNRARNLVLAQLDENPRDLQTWIWAIKVAANDREKRTILKHILELDPDHHAVRTHLNRLDEDSPGVKVEAPA